jgi:hypothetical protein
MNILLDRMPTAVEVGNREYELETDFRNCLKIMLAFEDPELTMREKQQIMLDLLYQDIPDDRLAAAEMAVRFLNFGESVDADDISDEQDRLQRVYSFDKDAKYIFSAFKQTHGIDLETVEYMHWWKFCCLFADLGECTFTQLIDLRSRKAKGKLTKEEREYCVRNANIVDLPRIKTSEELNAEQKFLNLLGKN